MVQLIKNIYHARTVGTSRQDMQLIKELVVNLQYLGVEKEVHYVSTLIFLKNLSTLNNPYKVNSSFIKLKRNYIC